MHDNGLPPPRLVAAKHLDGGVRVNDELLWEAMQKGIRVKEPAAQYEGEPRVAGIPISEVMEIFDRAGREALKRHKALGVPAVIWRDGKVVDLLPEEIDDFLANAKRPSVL